MQLLLYVLFNAGGPVGTQSILSIASLAVYSCLIFCCLLRPAEIVNLQWSDISLEYIEGKTVISIAIDHSKTSVRKLITEYVTSNDAFLFSMLLLLQELSSGSHIWGYPAPQFAHIFATWQIAAGLHGFSPYSFKRGGATAAFMAHRSYDRLCQEGRWSSITAARRYLDDSMSSLVRLRIPERPESYRRFLRRLTVSTLQAYDSEIEMAGLESRVLQW